jgi:hypothetical protein
MKPTMGDVHVSKPLTNISTAYIQDASNFAFTRLFGFVPVSKQTDKYYTFGKSDFMRSEAQLKGPKSSLAKTGYSISTDSYSCDVWAIGHEIFDQIRANADEVLDLDKQGAEYVMQQLLLKGEELFASTFLTTSVWGADKAGTTDFTKWSDSASNPISDVKGWKRDISGKTGRQANKLFMTRDIYDTLTEHPDVIDRIKYGATPGNPAIVNAQSIAALFELEEIVISDAVKETAKEGQTSSVDRIITDKMLLVHAPKTPGLMTPSAGYVFGWTGYTGASQFGTRVKKYRANEETECDIIEGQMAVDMKVVGSDLGVYINDAL